MWSSFRSRFPLILGLLICSQLVPAQLLRSPSMSKDKIVFSYADDLWLVERSGGEARRLTAGAGTEAAPYFSPDGNQIAFTGEYEGNVDVYVVPAAGGTPERLTHHPGSDVAVGWTPDGKVLFRSGRDSYNRFNRLFTVSLTGGLPEAVPLPMAEEGAFSPDSKSFAYVPVARAFQAWKRYRGGRATAIWLASLTDAKIVKVPRTDSNDFAPMWIGDTVYFLSDREGPITLFAYDTRSAKVNRVLENGGFDLKEASAGPGGIVYEQFGEIHIFDTAKKRAEKVNIRVLADLAEVRPRFVKAEKFIQTVGLSPTGTRAVFGVRGDILTVPLEKGDPRNITRSTGIAERDPAWSPDGKTVAYFSDASGEYQLHLADQFGREKPRAVALGDAPSFYYGLLWSPDSKRLAYYDKRLNLWVMEVASGVSTKVDTATYQESFRYFDPTWSPDSKYLAYAKQLPNRLCQIWAFDSSSGEKKPITDGMSDARFPVFDRGGKYLFLTASTNIGPTTGGLDLSSSARPVSSNAYVVVLKKTDPSPLAPESDEEKPAAGEAKKAEDSMGGQDAAKDGAQSAEGPATGEKKNGKKEPVPVTIDFDGITQRILSLPIPERNFRGLAAGPEGVLFLRQAPILTASDSNGADYILHRFDLKKRKLETFLSDVRANGVVSADGKKMLVRQRNNWRIVGTAAAPKAGDGNLSLARAEVWVDPRAEWRQMYNEVWRIERDFFYAPNFHGLNLDAAKKKYASFVETIATRADLNYLFNEMLGELSVGHLYVRGGDAPDVARVPVGLLGADFAIENGRYRFARVYNGENWNPELTAPLTQPGVNVAAGEYLLAVDGEQLRGSDEVFRFFLGKAGKQTVLKISASADGANARDVTVVPVASDQMLRTKAWVEDNRRYVSQRSGGKVAYIHLPDTAGGGYDYFNRYFFSQIDKEAVIIDERFNRGGKAADYIIDYLNRPLMNYWSSRDGKDYTTPATAIFGPKTMIVNEYAGSGGDAMPWYFRKAGLGKLIGKRTWGGLVGIGGYPDLVDGGSVTAPHFGFWNPEGKWDVENYGVMPDIEVDMEPAAWREGKDTQLEKAIETILGEMKAKPLPKHVKPAYPDYHTRPSQ
ncbi:MAG: PDZ domain-containing protein [Bryobacterales bacterium]|nr:PDZ domain-containing protein [Bryobacterales bacterium]